MHKKSLLAPGFCGTRQHPAPTNQKQQYSTNSNNVSSGLWGRERSLSNGGSPLCQRTLVAPMRVMKRVSAFLEPVGEFTGPTKAARVLRPTPVRKLARDLQERRNERRVLSQLQVALRADDILVSTGTGTGGHRGPRRNLRSRNRRSRRGPRRSTAVDPTRPKLLLHPPHVGSS